MAVKLVPWVPLVLLAIKSQSDLQLRYQGNAIYHLVGQEASRHLGPRLRSTDSLFYGILYAKNVKWVVLCVPLFLGLRSTQSPIKAPRRSTDPATTNPNTAVNSRLRPYSSIRNTEIAKCHMRSPCLKQRNRPSLCVVSQGAVCMLSHSIQ